MGVALMGEGAVSLSRHIQALDSVAPGSTFRRSLGRGLSAGRGVMQSPLGGSALISADA